jgi:voltage-gated potassium channel
MKKGFLGKMEQTFEIGLLIASIIVLGGLVADTFWKLPAAASDYIHRLDLALCAVLFCDFCYRFWNAPSKIGFMKWGWLDLIACIPNIDWLRAGRLVRILQVIRVFRGVRLLHRTIEMLLDNKLSSGVGSIFMLVMLSVVFSSMTILMFERDPSSNIKTVEDAIWWSIVTITTIGYGDKFPVTTEGRLIATFLMVVGVGLFSAFAGIMSAQFFRHNQLVTNDQLLQEIRSLKQDVQRLQSESRNPATATVSGGCQSAAGLVAVDGQPVSTVDQGA